MHNTNDKVTFSVKLQVINPQLEWNYLRLRYIFYTFCWFKSITWILHRWNTEFKWVNYPISRTYLLLDNVFIFFITHTSETALEWIFPKFKHIYEPISSQQSYRKLPHADWCSSKYGIENLGNFEEHWAKAEPKNSISHLIYKANNQLCVHIYFALVF